MTAELVAGRELDAEVATRVMGWLRRTTEFNSEQFVTVPPDWTDFSARRWLGHDLNELVPAYSTDISAAMGALDKWDGDYSIRRQNGVWRVELFRPSKEWQEWAYSLPLAICRVLLTAAQL